MANKGKIVDGGVDAPTSTPADAKYIAKIVFNDINDLSVKYEVGDSVDHFDDERIQRGIDNGLITQA